MLSTFRYFKATLLLFVVTLWLLPALNFANAIDLKLKVPGVLNVISYSEFKPISYANGAGYEGDLLRAVAKLWHVQIKFHPEAIFEGLWRLPSQSYTIVDMSMGGMTPSIYRIKEGALFSTTTTSFKQSLLVRKKDYQSGRIISYQSFKNTNLKIGVVPGTTGEQYAHIRAKENQLPPKIFIQYANESDLLPALTSGTIDAIARGEIGNEYQAAKNQEFMVIDKKDFGEQFAFAVNKTNNRLHNEINRAIKKVTHHGKITYSQWLHNHNVFLEQVDKLRTANNPCP